MPKKKRKRQRKLYYQPTYFPVPASWAEIKKTYRTAKRIKRAIRPPATQRLRRVKARIREIKAKEKTIQLEKKYKEMKAKWKQEHPGLLSKAKARYKLTKARMARPRKTIYT